MFWGVPSVENVISMCIYNIIRSIKGRGAQKNSIVFYYFVYMAHYVVIMLGEPKVPIYYIRVSNIIGSIYNIDMYKKKSENRS